MKDLAFLLGHYSELRAQALAEPATVDGKPSDVVYVMNDFVGGRSTSIANQTHRADGLQDRGQKAA